MIKLTSKWLKEQGACTEGYHWWQKNKETDPIETLKNLMDDNHHDWSNWLVVRLMTHEQQIMYAIFAAEQVIGIYEKRYPNDGRPRKAIDAAKGYLKYPDESYKKAANAAAYAAYAAAYTANAAANAAADAAAYAANAAANAAVYAAMLRTIIEYGITLLEEKTDGR